MYEDFRESFCVLSGYLSDFAINGSILVRWTMKVIPVLNESPHGYAQNIVARLKSKKSSRTDIEQELKQRSDEEIVRKEINRLLGFK